MADHGDADSDEEREIERQEQEEDEAAYEPEFGAQDVGAYLGSSDCRESTLTLESEATPEVPMTDRAHGINWPRPG